MLSQFLRVSLFAMYVNYVDASDPINNRLNVLVIFYFQVNFTYPPHVSTGARDLISNVSITTLHSSRHRLGEA